MFKQPKINVVTTLFAGLCALHFTAAHAGGVVTVDGSSTVYPISAIIAEDFQGANDAKVTVGVSGTGGGFKKFCAGQTDISDASRPILKKEMELCKAAGIQYIELPIAFDALTVVVNPSNTAIKSLTIAQLKTMWAPEAQGKINNWNQVDPSFPDLPLKLFGAGSDSGTFDYFTEAVVGKAKSSRGDYTASEDDNVLVQGVSRDKGGLGYFGFAYYIENAKKLRAVPIVSTKTNKPVSPSAQTVENGTYEPLSRPLFIYVSVKSLARPEVKAFVDYYLANAAKASKEVRYVALPAKAYAMAQGHLNKKKVGTVFDGTPEIGVEISELLAREAKE